MSLTRRRFIACAAALGVPASRIRAQTTLAPTPAMTEGPFYPEAFSKEPMPDLVRGALLANAIPLALAGRILDRFGKPVDGARVEIWLADGLGHYHHSRDSRSEERDPNFAGAGWVRTGADGRYAFAAIRPVPYPGRTPHIHFAVKAAKQKPLITQMFIEGVAQNARDGIYGSLNVAERQRVIATLEPAGAGQKTSFDLILA